MTAFAAAIDMLFADPHLARDVIYMQDGGTTKVVRAILRRPDEITDFGAARILSDSTLIDVRISEIADPRPGDRITIDAEKLVIEGEPQRDRERLVWTIQACASLAHEGVIAVLRRGGINAAAINTGPMNG